MIGQAVREPLNIESRLNLDMKTRGISRSTSPSYDQDIVNNVIRQLDDMFLRLFCMGTDKAEMERFREKTISSIVDIKKSLDSLGLKYINDI